MISDQVTQLTNEGRYDEAYRLAVRGATVNPDDALSLAQLRDLLVRRRCFEASLVLARRVIGLAPYDGTQWHALATSLLCLDRFAEAGVAVDKALELAPEQPAHWHQAALVAYRQNDHHAALRMADRAQRLDPYGNALKHDLAHILLALGNDLPVALEAYEVRWETLLHLRPWDLHLPEWKGESLKEKRVLFHSEQGYGDALMMARFARNLLDAGALEVGLCLPKELTRLFAVQTWPGVRVVEMPTVEADDWDVHTPMFSALRWLGLQRTEIDATPYLTQVPRIVVPPLPDGFRVGICWGSGKWNIDTALRRIAPLELLLPLTEIPGVRLVSLQQGENASDIQRLGAEAIIHDPMPACTDFAATAAVISRLDAVVTVDSAIVHLAAAMGKPTFMLTQYSRCWRWWDFPRGYPWYDTMWAAQQEKPDDWTWPAREAAAFVRTKCASRT